MGIALRCSTNPAMQVMPCKSFHAGCLYRLGPAKQRSSASAVNSQLQSGEGPAAADAGPKRRWKNHLAERHLRSLVLLDKLTCLLLLTLTLMQMLMVMLTLMLVQLLVLMLMLRLKQMPVLMLMHTLTKTLVLMLMQLLMLMLMVTCSCIC